MKKILSIVVLSLLTTPALAVQSFFGDTTGKPTYNRALQGFGGLSAVGTAVHYEVIAFTVTVTGSYTWQNTASGLWDNFTFIYKDSFNPANATLNGVASNDDNPSIGLSGFTAALTAGTSYFYVVTGFGNNDQGAWRADVSTTSGGLVVVPAPGAAALMGLGMLTAARRRR